MLNERELLDEIRYVCYIVTQLRKLNFRKFYRGWIKYCDTIFEVKYKMCVWERVRRLISIYKEYFTNR